MIKAGILSDTHLSKRTTLFQQLAQKAFSDCAVIFHAGDITDVSILDVFKDKTVHAVHGNMCSYNTQLLFPKKKIVKIGNHTIGLCHGAGSRYNIEERMWSLFPEADCIIYGHTHQPVCEKKGGPLFINPGSFQCSGPYGSPASYAILELTDTDIEAALHTIHPDQ